MFRKVFLQTLQIDRGLVVGEETIVLVPERSDDVGQ